MGRQDGVKRTRAQGGITLSKSTKSQDLTSRYRALRLESYLNSSKQLNAVQPSPNLNWVENDAVWLSTAIIILANYESSFGKAFNRDNKEFKNK